MDFLFGFIAGILIVSLGLWPYIDALKYFLDQYRNDYLKYSKLYFDLHKKFIDFRNKKV